MLRRVEDQVQGHRTTDGAGVSLVRVLGNETFDTFDPFLMLDAFDSTDPADYTAGFPMHPHRGIETVTFLSRGTIIHEDHLGTKAAIHDGEAQWLTAGSGAFHSEMPQPAPRMLGVQLWLNIPARQKMAADPFYHGILSNEIQEFDLGAGTLRLIAGTYAGHSGMQGKYLPLDFYDIRWTRMAQPSSTCAATESLRWCSRSRATQSSAARPLLQRPLLGSATATPLPSRRATIRSRYCSSARRG